MIYRVFSILEAIDLYGEEIVLKLISSFSCGNKDVDDFLHAKSIDFAKQYIGITFLVFDLDIENLLGVFCLSNRSTCIDCSGLSNRMKKKISKQAFQPHDNNKYYINAFLIGQFGKNKNIPEIRQIRGSHLMNIALGKLEIVKNIIACNIVWLDCDCSNKDAISFYERENFTNIGIRNGEEATYIQYIKFI